MASARGQILRESVGKYVAEKRAAGQIPSAPLARALFEQIPDPKDNDLLARTIVGVMTGALPTINGNQMGVVKSWAAIGNPDGARRQTQCEQAS